MYSKLIKGSGMRQTPRRLTTQAMSRNRAIHDALKEQLVNELEQNGTLGKEGRTVTTDHPRLKLRVARA